MGIDEILNIVGPFQECLRKMDGQRYKSAAKSSILSGLYMKQLFMKDCIGNWRMNEPIADRWEEQQYNHYKQRRSENIARGQQVNQSKNLSV